VAGGGVAVDFTRATREDPATAAVPTENIISRSPCPFLSESFSFPRRRRQARRERYRSSQCQAQSNFFKKKSKKKLMAATARLLGTVQRRRDPGSSEVPPLGQGDACG